MKYKPKKQYRNALNKFKNWVFFLFQMELLSKILEQGAFNKIRKNEEHMFFVMEESIQEEHLFQPIQIIGNNLIYM